MHPTRLEPAVGCFLVTRLGGQLESEHVVERIAGQQRSGGLHRYVRNQDCHDSNPFLFPEKSSCKPRAAARNRAEPVGSGLCATVATRVRSNSRHDRRRQGERRWAGQANSGRNASLDGKKTHAAGRQENARSESSTRLSHAEGKRRERSGPGPHADESRRPASMAMRARAEPEIPTELAKVERCVGILPPLS